MTDPIPETGSRATRILEAHTLQSKLKNHFEYRPHQAIVIGPKESQLVLDCLEAMIAFTGPAGGNGPIFRCPLVALSKETKAAISADLARATELMNDKETYL